MTVAFLPSSTVQTAQANGVASFTFDSNGIQSGVEAPIKSITASIASNAITVTLPPATLDFRSTTLTNGAPTQIQTTSTLSLTIASTDSFGLVTAAGNQRLVIFAMNNAGTVELGAATLSGGFPLDETALITTGTSPMVSTQGRLSAVARSNLAYRVVGFVDATFTTGTGWGTLALVQGQGGQALAAMSSLGYGQTWQAPARSSGVTYYNTTGKPIGWSMTVDGGTPNLSMQINGTERAFTYISASSNPFAFLIVPPGASYVGTVGGGGSIRNWHELR